MIEILFYIIIIISLINMISAIISKEPKLMSYMFWLFCFYFFGVAPLVQYNANIFPWGARPLDKYIIQAQFLVIIFLIAYSIGYNIKKYKSQSNIYSEPLQDTRKIIRFSTISTCIIVVLLLLFGFSVNDFFGGRAGLTEVFRADTNTTKSIYMALIRVPSAGILLLMVITLSSSFKLFSKKNKILSISIIVTLLVINSPFAHSRFWAGAVYMSVIFILLYSYSKTILRVFMLANTFLIIPLFFLLSQVRYKGLNEIALNSEINLYSGGFDAFQQIVNGIEYVGKYGIDYGYQLLGPLLFWVPRVLWANKPVGTGYLMHERLGYSFLNVSAPIIVEGYITFGIMGVITLGLLWGSLSIKLEYLKFNQPGKNKKISIQIISWMLISYQWILLRGDLMTFVRYLAPLLIFVWVALICIRSKFK